MATTHTAPTDSTRAADDISDIAATAKGIASDVADRAVALDPPAHRPGPLAAAGRSSCGSSGCWPGCRSRTSAGRGCSSGGSWPAPDRGVDGRPAYARRPRWSLAMARRFFRIDADDDPTDSGVPAE